MTPEQALQTMLELTPRIDWGTWLDANVPKETDRQRLAEAANHLAILSAELSCYIEHRGGGISDQGHNAAMIRAQTTRRRVRKALGYTYP